MTLKLSKLIAFTVLVSILKAQSATPDEVADRIDVAVRQLREETIVKGLREVPPVASRHLQGYTDEERLRGIDVWMNRAKGTDRVWMPGFAGDLLKNDPNAIKDSSELRKLLATEDDPSRFFLLSKFSTSFIIRGENFIPEESRMLFRHGRVAEQTNNTTYSKVLGDVSAYTYESIVNTLGFLHAPFDEATMLPNGGQIPYPEKIQILAKWLRENWPGCENLGNAETLSVESVHEPKRHVESETRPKKPLPLQTNEEAANQPVAIKLWWLAITVGIIVLAVLVAWLKRKSNAP